MHNIDRTNFEFSPTGELDVETFPFMAAGETELFGEAATAFDEIEESELAAELLGVTSEEELDQFLGGLLRKGAAKAGKLMRSPIGRSLGGMLKSVAKTALPGAGAMLGNFMVPGLGGMLGGKLGSMAGSLFGLEVEGLSSEDQEYEVARRFVRLAGSAAQNAALAPATVPALVAAQQALAGAARAHAPGLLAQGNGRSGTSATIGATGRSGRWIRRGNKIILMGV